MCPTFDKHFGFIFVVTSELDRKIQYHENRTFLFCLSIHWCICFSGQPFEIVWKILFFRSSYKFSFDGYCRKYEYYNLLHNYSFVTFCVVIHVVHDVGTAFCNVMLIISS